MALVTLPRPQPAPVAGPVVAPEAARRPEAARPLYPPPLAVVVAVVAAAAGTAWSAATHSMTLYGDARAHLDVARHVTDGLTPGLAQLGSVWLPLPHMLLVPFVAINPLWHNGAAGAIVSGLCFVYTALRIFSLVEELTASRLGAWVGMAVFIANLNMLYIQSTALTEPVLLAFSVGAVFHLSRWMRTLAVRELLWASLFVFCATLTRYEGWALLGASLVVVAVWVRLADRRRKSPQASLVLFAAIALYGLVLWFLYNLIIFHDPLYFLHSAYSAQAINGAQAQFGLLGTKGSIGQSTLTYGWDMVDVIGGPVLILGGRVAGGPGRRPASGPSADPVHPGPAGAPRWSSRSSPSTPGRPPSGCPSSSPTGCGTTATAWWPYRCAPWPSAPWSVGGAGPCRWPSGPRLLATVFMALGTPLTLADGRTGTSSAAGRPSRGGRRLPGPPLPGRRGPGRRLGRLLAHVLVGTRPEGSSSPSASTRTSAGPSSIRPTTSPGWWPTPVTR